MAVVTETMLREVVGSATQEILGVVQALATHQYEQLEDVRHELRSEFKSLLGSKIGQVNQRIDLLTKEMHQQGSDVRAEMRNGFCDVRARIDSLRERTDEDICAVILDAEKLNRRVTLLEKKS